MCPGNRIPYLTIKEGALDYNECLQVSMSRWLKLVSVLLMAGVVVAVVSPDFDLQPPVARVSRATPKPPVVVFAAIRTAAIKDCLMHSVPSSPLAFLFRSFGNLSANLIDLNCTRLC
jgi:hypothetical protein